MQGIYLGISPSLYVAIALMHTVISRTKENTTATMSKCAIEECDRPRYVDDWGKIHECCGYTHAMEYQRRQAVMKQRKIKGITHCYLPNCDRPTWPFENYCGRTHADLGKRMGLPRPPSTPSGVAAAITDSTPVGSKDRSICILPECTRPKYVDHAKGVTHDYCGKTHSLEGQRRGIRPQAVGEDDKCELPGCTNKKRVEGTRVFDYCCRQHAAQDEPGREARTAILTNSEDVRQFLGQFPSLKVVSIEENVNAKSPSGKLFKRFKQAYDQIPKDQRRTCLAFHGTGEDKIDSICTNGYDSSRRGTSYGQAYGAGEYFATNPSTSLRYCKGKKMILNELLLGQNGVHHTKSGDIIVMKYPDHDLPRFIITFQ